MVHGDDFVAVGPRKHLAHTKAALEEKYKIKTEELGRGKGQKEEVRILNKVVRVTDSGIELEADPRHAELVVKELELDNAKPSPVPGSKEEAKRMMSASDGEKTKVTTAATKARISVGNDVDSIESARKSAGGTELEGDASLEIEYDQDGEDQELDAGAARLYRAVAARLNYIAPDRPDIGYAVKESARSMSRPRWSDMRRLKKIGKYLIGKPRLVARFDWQEWPDRVTTFTDSDWAGCGKTAKSTSGGAVCIGEHVIKTFASSRRSSL